MIQLNTLILGNQGGSIVSKDIKTAKTPAQRKADERKRRREAGQVLVQEWVHSDDVASLKNHANKLRKK